MITRTAIAHYAESAFSSPDTATDGRTLIETLRRSGAPKQMTDLVAAKVPDSARLTSLRSLWRYLPDIPVTEGSG